MLRRMTTAPEDAASFEQALERLEAIVDAMEDGRTPLAELLQRYEEGTRLLKICEARLQTAELRLEVLKKTREAVTLEPFAPERGE
jgi:exodeoxyribonuclease VII small subunit